MTLSKSALAKGAIAGLVAAVSIAGSTAAAAKTYVVCNRWDECWRVHEHYTTYPSDVRIVYHDDAWWAAHEHDKDWHYRLLTDPSDDHGWYDKDGVWHPFGAPPS
jgi:hypothetical protein